MIRTNETRISPVIDLNLPHESVIVTTVMNQLTTKLSKFGLFKLYIFM